MFPHVGTQGHTSQLDYILLDNWSSAKLQDVEAGRGIHVGSDHACLKAEFNFKRRSRQRKKTKDKPPGMRPAWPPASIQDYATKPEELLPDVWHEEAVHDTYRRLQVAIAEASLGAAPEQNRNDEDKNEATSSANVVQKIIDERKALPSTDTSRRCEISKDIKKTIKKMKDEERSMRIINEDQAQENYRSYRRNERGRWQSYYRQGIHHGHFREVL